MRNFRYQTRNHVDFDSKLGGSFPNLYYFRHHEFRNNLMSSNQVQERDLPMANSIYNDDRIFFPEDPELRVLGSTELLAQWRHRNAGPAFIRIGRRIGYHGTDLNAYLNARRVDPNTKAA